MKNSINVITYGTFDTLHYGHILLLQRAKNLGTKLIVGCSTDNFCLQKGKQPLLTFDERVQLLYNLTCVDEVIAENSMEQKINDVKKFNVDIFVLGDDYENIFPSMPEYSQILQQGVKVIFLPRTPNISSTMIKKGLL